MSLPDLKETLLDAALIHVAFDGWTPETFAAAVAETGAATAAATPITRRCFGVVNNLTTP